MLYTETDFSVHRDGRKKDKQMATELARIAELSAQNPTISVDECLNILNKKSGVLALSNNLSSDFRDLGNGAAEGKEECQLALDKFAYEVAKYVGAYAVALKGLDVIIN